MEDNKNRYNGVGKIFAMVLTILVCFGGLWAAMNLQLKQMRENVESVRADYLEHARLEGHLGMMKRIGADEKMYEEIETQFDWANDVANLRANFAEGQRQMLWKQVFGMDLPSAGYYPLKMDGK